ncbi:cytochrome c-type biogenesis protein CcmH [Aquibacillus sp. 3ASR75-11]|uniref:Cytochrome c-type biogenesis protein n=1 Tax=Terrihalobacillus insolitus TaxID=2950438 RepID=A0A9X3WUE2_9BACI|nr:cytochrome c-type biogenesis protein CcmH [Terrihalobacillus insolitus]MDC3425775.1 cytochrome c-type biogenesis protein CcmH [Terrihalobacillus insolitus]
MAATYKWVFLYLPTLWFLTLVPRIGLAAEDKVSVTRREVLNVAKEIHPPGCLDSMTADYCNLSTAYETRSEIRGLLEQGMSKNEVIDTLVQKYGDRILASPSTEGFNLIPWIAPGISVVLGAALVIFIIYQWSKKKPQESEDYSEPTITDEDKMKINEELKNWL